MKVATSEEMQDIDRRTIEGYGIPGLVLMERAGVAVAVRIRELFGKRKVIVLSGSGNNGGDGIVAARELYNSGFNVQVLMAGGRKKMSPDCKRQFDIAKKMGIPMAFRSSVESRDLHGSVVVDAIFGTGLSKRIKSPIADTISSVNDSGQPVVSVDIPSGVSADTGQVLGTAIMATHTVTFGLPKRGHLLHPGAGHTGGLFVEDIGFPRTLFNEIRCGLPSGEDMALLVPGREAYSHKRDYGHVLLLAGSKGKTGAALMAARAALRAGAGLVTIGAPEQLGTPYQSSVTEEMFLPLPDSGEGALSAGALDVILEFMDKQADILAMGPGLGRAGETVRLLHELLANSTAPMVIDADAINALAGRASLLKRVKGPVIITPHPGEFSRIAGMGIKEIEQDRVEAASGFSQKSGVHVILKGAPTVIAEPGGEVFINPTGNPGMATAGTGDVLTGMVASFLGQGLSPTEASILAVYMHGLAGDMAASELGQHSVLASDITDALPGAFGSIGSGKWTA
jgi:NAD(P)H-hydrate epimerase